MRKGELIERSASQNLDALIKDIEQMQQCAVNQGYQEPVMVV